MNDGEFSIPLGIISFKTASNPSSSSNPGPSTSSAADHDDKEGEEDKEEVTVRLMKEEAGLVLNLISFLLVLLVFCFPISFPSWGLNLSVLSLCANRSWVCFH